MLSILRRVVAVIIFLLGLCMLLGGAYLLYLGGSAYYVPAGLFLLLSGFWIWRGDCRGAWLYLVLLVATAIWSVAEVGGNLWALLPRLAMLVFIGLWLFVPWRRQGLVRGQPSKPRYLGIALGVVLLAGVGIASITHSSRELPPETAAVEASPVVEGASETGPDWSSYGGTEHGNRYAALDQITPDNVKDLKFAWTYQTGDLKRPNESGGVEFENTPLAIGHRLYVCTPHYMVDALDADTGERLWRFDPENENPNAMVKTCRGVAFAQTGPASAEADGSCASRILLYTGDSRLIALDASSGKVCPSFGDGGTVDLKQGMGKVQAGFLSATSPPTIIDGLVVIGSQVIDNRRVDEPSGVIRAYDAVTGELAWAWDMGRPDRTGLPPEGQTYTRATPNAWAPLAADAEAGLVFVPLGNQTPDFYAGDHRSDVSERYTDALVALDARTGREQWHFQTTHHDTWDYDLPAQPVLVDWNVDGTSVPAVIQSTKRGEFFVLNRLTGEPIMPVVEQPVPQDDPLPGEWLSKTQPFSPGMPQLNTADPFTEEQMWGMTPIDQLECRIMFRKYRYEGQFTPQSTQGTINDPGNAGYMDWGGVSIDRSRHLMMVNSIRLPFVLTAIPREQADEMGVSSAPGVEKSDGIDAMGGLPFAMQTKPFLSSAQVPCLQPPWGYMQAINLDTQKTVWKRPLGTGRDSGPFGLNVGPPVELGVFSQGGVVTTKSGITFIGSTSDRYLRAIDNRTGEELWRARLPAGGQASPISFQSDASGRQYVVIAAGGHVGLKTKIGDYVMAYALPEGEASSAQ